jgi:hypothetical protein
MVKKEEINMVDKDLRKQIRLQDEIDHNLDMGYLPPSEKVRQLKEFEGKTGIMIRNPGKQDRINSECPPGFEFVHAHNKSDCPCILQEERNQYRDP